MASMTELDFEKLVDKRDPSEGADVYLILRDGTSLKTKTVVEQSHPVEGIPAKRVSSMVVFGNQKAAKDIAKVLSGKREIKAVTWNEAWALAKNAGVDTITLKFACDSEDKDLETFWVR